MNNTQTHHNSAKTLIKPLKQIEKEEKCSRGMEAGGGGTGGQDGGMEGGKSLKKMKSEKRQTNRDG